MSDPLPKAPLPRTLRALAQRFDLSKLAVLEIGCGSGANLQHFSERSLGLDRDPACIAEVSARGLRAVKRDVSRWGWSQDLGRFDLVWISGLLVELEEPRAFLEEVGCVLEPEGRVLVAEWLWPESPVAATALSCLVPGGRTTLTEPENRRRYHRRTLAADLGAAGLVIESSFNHSLPPGALARALDSFWPPRTIVARPAG
ncbi:MAG: class I SAM-dependent methyltransferase [Planctomycetes bacterium]|nr:class I SAM-dependent methyltransferase [Planctomycetota bacterium]